MAGKSHLRHRERRQPGGQGVWVRKVVGDKPLLFREPALSHYPGVLARRGCHGLCGLRLREPGGYGAGWHRDEEIRRPRPALRGGFLHSIPNGVVPDRLRDLWEMGDHPHRARHDVLPRRHRVGARVWRGLGPVGDARGGAGSRLSRDLLGHRGGGRLGVSVRHVVERVLCRSRPPAARARAARESCSSPVPTTR